MFDFQTLCFFYRKRITASESTCLIYKFKYQKMKTPTQMLITLATVSILFIGFSACSDDDDHDNKNFKLTGTWQLDVIEVDANPIAGSNMSEIQLENALADYTFFSSGSQMSFTADSVSLVASVMGSQLPFTLPYNYKGNVLTITPPMNLPILIQGTIDLTANTMEFDLTPESYMSILQILQPPFFDQILSAEVDYDFSRVK